LPLLSNIGCRQEKCAEWRGPLKLARLVIKATLNAAPTGPNQHYIIGIRRMNGKQRRVAYEDSMVIAVALQGRASTLAYPILCSELDALFRLVRPLADADDALRNC
jgi:hypothetical protein